MNLLQESWHRLFPNKAIPYKTKMKFSGKFSNYNANIKLYNNILELSLCKKWKDVNNEITIGLVQSLIAKITKNKVNTINIDLYNGFVKNLHMSIPKDNIEPYLEESFDRVNQEYFSNTLEIPNLVWGSDSRRKLGCYDFKSDTITMSTVFKNTSKDLLDYVMYHEMLHKKHKFSNKNNRNLYHSKNFRDAERKFPNSQQLEFQLSKLSNKRPRSMLQKLFSIAKTP